MIINKKDFLPCFELLRSVLYEAFQIETLYYTPPYDDLTQIDQGIRGIIWPDFDFHHESLTPCAQNPNRRFFIVQSNLGFSNIIVYLNFESKPDFISIGPFHADVMTMDYFQELIASFNSTETTVSVLQSFYNSVPSAPTQSVVNIAKQILCSFFPFFEKCNPVQIEFSNRINNIKPNSQSITDWGFSFSDNYREGLFRLLETVSKGQYETALPCMKEFLRSSKILNDHNLNNCRQNVHLLNAYLQLVLLNTNVHPVHIFKLYINMRIRIDSIDNRDALLNIPNELCHKYCLLVKNYAFPDYSKTVRSVVNYIHMHLEEELTLSIIAAEFQKNPSSLSAAFSKEVGTSITNYIHQTRINEAIRLFNTTKLSISEAAFAVGFHDFAYFSRLFHKQVGCSPRDYCKSIR